MSRTDRGKTSGGSVAVVTTLLLSIPFVGCTHSAVSTEAKRRPLDQAPRETTLRTPLPDRQAVAFFAVDTGGDQLSTSRKEAGLEVVVRFRSRELRQTIASCADPSTGSALGGGTERELEVALCGGEYWLIAEPGRVVVERKDSTPPAQVCGIALPWTDVRAHAAEVR
jgi:hypothetical protein